jgi:hypothetical protein
MTLRPFFFAILPLVLASALLASGLSGPVPTGPASGKATLSNTAGTSQGATATVPVTAAIPSNVPEPTTLILVGGGLLVLGLIRRRGRS